MINIVKIKKMKIKKDIIAKIRGNNELNAKLQLAMGVTGSTVNRWLKINHRTLTNFSAMACMAEYFGIMPSELLEERDEKTPAGWYFVFGQVKQKKLKKNHENN